MPDEQVPGQTTEGAPADASTEASPALTEDRILELISQGVQTAFDSRIPGLQSAYDKQISALKRDVERSNLSPDEIEAADMSQLEAERDQARRELAAAQAAIRFPDLYPVYDRMMKAESAEEQFAILQEIRGASQPAPQEGDGDSSPETQQQTGQPAPPIDPNRPIRDPFSAPFEGQMSRELAEKILSSATSWPT